MQTFLAQQPSNNIPFRLSIPGVERARTSEFLRGMSIIGTQLHVQNVYVLVIIINGHFLRKDQTCTHSKSFVDSLQ